jgi:hypothetical protein
MPKGVMKTMAEKVISEIRLIETDDGFRLEVKGDKERMKKMGFGPGMWGPGMGSPGMGGPWGFGHRHGFGRHGWRGHGPWGWWGEEPEQGKTSEEPPVEA